MGSTRRGPMRAEDQRRLAMTMILEAWEAALGTGVETRTFASAALQAALTDMVEIYGEAAVAEMTDQLATRVRAGDFSCKAERGNPQASAGA